MRRPLAVVALAAALLVPIVALAAGGTAQLARDLAGAGGTLAYHRDTGFARFYSAAPDAAALSAAGRWRSPEWVARRFLSTYGPLFGIDDADAQLALLSDDGSDSRTVLRFAQVHDGIPVLGGEFVLQVAGGSVTTVSGEAAPVKGVANEATVAAVAAANVARQAIGKARDLPPESLLTSEPQLAIYYPPLLGPGPERAALVWRLEVTSAQVPSMRELALIDATSGALALHFDSGEQARARAVYDALGGTALPGTLVRSEGSAASGDAEVDAGYDYSGDFYDFYFDRFGRDSFDGLGATLVTSIRYGGSCPNAFWNGEQANFCAGLTVDDVVAHEYSHAVTQYTSGLFYYYQSGALNEGMSDVFGEMIDLSNGSADDTAGVRWQVGEYSSLGVLRDMKNPPAYSDPDRLTSPYWYCAYSAQDNGGVHTNSTVLGKAGYLMVDGGTFNGYTITGLGIDKSAAIFYEMQVHLLTSGSDYEDVHEALPQACRNLVGSDGITEGDCDQVVAVVDATEMDQPPAVCGRSEAPYCPDGQVCTDLFYDDLEHPDLGRWTTYSLAGGNIWYYPQNPNPYFDMTYATSGTTNMFGDDVSGIHDGVIAMTSDVALPAGTQAYLRFNHSYLFEYGGSSYYDAGVVEYSLDGGNTWLDAADLFDANGYRGTVSSAYGNPLGGRPAFVAGSLGYTSSRLDLSSLAGQSVRFRFRIGLDADVGAWGWFIDDVRLYTASETPTPPGFSVSIDGGALYTNSTSVVLSLSAATGYNEMQVSNDGGFAGAAWEPFAATKAWQISEYGTSAIPRVVYVRFRDGAANEETRSDDIILDRAGPTGSVHATVSGSGMAIGSQVVLQLSASDDASGVAGMILADDSLFTGASWQSFASTAAWSGGSGIVYARFRDGAGNESAAYTAAYIAVPQRYLPLLQ
ncbi:MAG: M4 family metallopeptidase [Anaerolineae bacterium]